MRVSRAGNSRDDLVHRRHCAAGLLPTASRRIRRRCRRWNWPSSARRYVDALKSCGLRVSVLDADPAFPDSTFVEDTAVIVGSRALLTRPGAASRLGEAAAIRGSLARLFPELGEMTAPGTLDGGDVCETEDRVYIGLSARTNRAGAEQLAAFLAQSGIASTVVDIRDLNGILHLKSGMSYLGDGVFVVIEELLPRLGLNGARVVSASAGEEYGARLSSRQRHHAGPRRAPGPRSAAARL